MNKSPWSLASIPFVALVALGCMMTLLALYLTSVAADAFTEPEGRPWTT